MKQRIIIGSRRSRLAVRQAELAGEALSPFLLAGSGLEYAIYDTKGDKFLAGNLSEIGNKGLFTKEIEQALLAGEIDIAVHSMKDMATEPPEGLVIAAMLPRDDVRDAFLCTSASNIMEIKQGAVIGTSSLRRAMQIQALRPDVLIVNYRGNLDRRISNLEAGEVDATLLAMAGLDRLGMHLPYAHAVPVTQMLPAVAQGAIGLQCRADDKEILALCQQTNHAPTMQGVTLERVFLRELDGSCRTPIAAYAAPEGEGFRLHGWLANAEDATKHISDNLFITANRDGIAEAKALAQQLKEKLFTL